MMRGTAFCWAHYTIEAALKIALILALTLLTDHPTIQVTTDQWPTLVWSGLVWSGVTCESHLSSTHPG